MSKQLVRRRRADVRHRALGRVRLVVLGLLSIGCLVGVTSPAGAAVTPSLSVAPSHGDAATLFFGGGGGFTPDTTATITVVQPDGTDYSAPYTHTRPVDTTGSLSWTWRWDPGDEFGTYTFIATDVSGPSAQVSFTIDAPDLTHPAPLLGFDTASAPSQATMDAWLAGSSYRAVGVYVAVGNGYDDRADKTQLNLTPQWVQTQRRQGWSIVPIYIGEQAPTACARVPGLFWEMPSNPASARSHGAAAAMDAAASVAGLGMPSDAPVYYDMEPYNGGRASAVLAFVDGWVTELHALGHLAGVYGLAQSMIGDLTGSVGAPSMHEPDAVWVATRNDSNGVDGLGTPPDGWWLHGRINQARLDTTETHGGVSMDIDVDPIDAPVVGPLAVPGRPVKVTATAGDSTATVSWTAGAYGGSVRRYQVTASPGGATVTTGWAARSVVVGGLQDGRSYTFTVVAVNSEGASAGSVPSAAVVPAGRPGRVGKVHLALHHRRLVVTWRGAAANGSGIRHYLVAVNGRTKTVGEVRRLVIRHPHRGLCKVRVTAVNGLGQGIPSRTVRIRVGSA